MKGIHWFIPLPRGRGKTYQKLQSSSSDWITSKKATLDIYDDCLCLLQVLPNSLEDLNFCVSSKSFHTFQQHFPSIFTDQDGSFCDRGDGASFSHLHLQSKSHAKHVVILMWMYNFRTKKDMRIAAQAFNEMFFVIVIVMETVCACKPPVVVGWMVALCKPYLLAVPGGHREITKNCEVELWW